MDPDVSISLDGNGERMVPSIVDLDTLWEHIYRYKFATKYISNKDVLDVACGEGYGSAAMLKGGAKSIIGVDRDPKIVSHACQRYNIDARQGDATSLPLPDGSVDVVVSFETIEHISKPDDFILECRRVLRPNGLLIISTPNVEIFNPERSATHNPHHISEMTEAEFRSAIYKHFKSISLWYQLPARSRFWTRSALRLTPNPWGFLSVIRNLVANCHVRREDNILRAREDTAQEILKHEPISSRLVNPYRVHRPSRGEQAKYILIIATV